MLKKLSILSLLEDIYDWIFFPNCIVSEVIVVRIKVNNITIIVKNMVVVNNEAIVLLILNFFIK